MIITMWIGGIFSPLNEQRRIVDYLDRLPPYGDGDLRSERVNALRRLQAESQVELDALLPSPTGMVSVLRPQGGAFRGEF